MTKLILKIILKAVLIVLAVLLLIHTKNTCHGAVSPAKAEEIYRNLIKYTSNAAKMPVFRVILVSEKINASVNFDLWEINITTGMLNFIKTESEAAAILGHEIGHVLIQDNILNPNNDINIQTLLEANADKYSIYFMLRAGYNICEAGNVWIRLRDNNGDKGYNSSHPNYSYRVWQLDFPQCKSFWSKRVWN